MTVEIDTSTIPWMPSLDPSPPDWSDSLSPEIESVREALRTAHVSSHDSQIHQDGYSYSVLTRFHIRMGEDKTSFQMRVMKDGKWTPARQPTFFSVKTVPAAGRLLKAVLSLSPQAPEPLSSTGDVLIQRAKASDEARAFAVEQVATLIRADIEAARIRVAGQVEAILMDPEAMWDAVQVWEDAMRKEVRSALLQVRHIPKEYVRRFVEELIVEEVQES